MAYLPTNENMTKEEMDYGRIEYDLQFSILEDQFLYFLKHKAMGFILKMCIYGALWEEVMIHNFKKHIIKVNVPLLLLFQTTLSGKGPLLCHRTERYLREKPIC